MLAVFFALILLFLVSQSLHLTGAATACLVGALLLLHPVRCLVKLCITGVFALVVVTVDALLRLVRGADRDRVSPTVAPAKLARQSATPAPVPRREWQGQASAQTVEQIWEGQAGPFLDNQGKPTRP